MRFRLIKSGVLTFMTFTLFRGVFSDKIYVPTWPRKIASVCRLCGSSVAYSHHRVALFGKKDSQERVLLSIKDKPVGYNVEL